jgi:hypothetical protein
MVKVNIKYGYIDTTGKMAIEPRFDTAGYFNNLGLAKVSIKGVYDYINAKGQNLFFIK